MTEASAPNAVVDPPAWSPPPERGPVGGQAYGTFVPRFGAAIADVLLISLLVGLWWTIGESVGLSRATVRADWLVILIVVAWLSYFYSKVGATPGMRLLHLRVARRRDGARLSTVEGVLRAVGLILSFVPLLGIVSAFAIVSGRERRSLADVLGNSVVVKATGPAG